MELKDVVDFVVKIREQDVQFFQTLLTIFAGSFLAAIIVAAIATRSSEAETTQEARPLLICLRKILAFLSLGFFLAFLFFVRVEQTTKREFCTKWMANHVSSGEDPALLIQKFSSGHYTLECDDANYVIEPNDIPEIWGQCLAIGPKGLIGTFAFPAISAFFLIIAIFLPTRKKPKDE